MSQSLEANIDMLLIELQQFVDIVFFDLVVVHQSETAISEYYFELQSSLFLLEEM